MSAFAMAIVVLMFFLFGILLGAKVGDELSKTCVTAKDYWKQNAKVLGGGVLVSAIVLGFGLTALTAFPIGFMGGALTGLKLGFGESVGPWKFHDKKLGVNKEHLARAGSKQAEETRRRRVAGEPEPELMSVADDDTKKGSDTQS